MSRPRGAPKGHRPYRARLLTSRFELWLTPQLKADIEQQAESEQLTASAWIRLTIEQRLATKEAGNGHS